MTMSNEGGVIVIAGECGPGRTTTMQEIQARAAALPGSVSRIVSIEDTPELPIRPPSAALSKS